MDNPRGDDFDPTKTLQVNISLIREEIGKEHIQTVVGKGYRFIERINNGPEPGKHTIHPKPTAPPVLEDFIDYAGVFVSRKRISVITGPSFDHTKEARLQPLEFRVLEVFIRSRP